MRGHGRSLGVASMLSLSAPGLHLVLTQLVVCLAPLLFPLRSVQAQESWEFSWHKSEITDLAFSPDGSRLYSTSLRDDRISGLKISDTSDTTFGSSLGKITGARSHAVAVSPDGGKIATAGFKSTKVVDATNGMELWKISTSPEQYSPPFATALVFSPDGSQLALSGSSSKVGGRHGYKGGLVRIMDAHTGKEIRQFDGLSHAVESIAFSPNGKLFAAGTKGAGGELPEPGEVRVWNANDRKLLHVWRVVDSVHVGEERYAAHGISFSPDSRSIAVANSDGKVRIWNVAEARIRTELKGHRRSVQRVAFSPDGQLLASGGLDQTVRLWDTATGRQLKSFEVRSPKISALVFNPEGDLLVAGGGDFLRMGEVRVWQVGDVE